MTGRTGRQSRLLVVDDDDEVRSLLKRILEADGHVVEQAADVAGALAALDERAPDLVLLDVMLDGEDGLDVLNHIRRTRDTPVILLTGKGAETDRILGLKLGADDYVVKPFFPGELAARVATVLRRTAKAAPRSNRIEHGPLVIETATREVTCDGEGIELTAKEFDLLAFLATSPRQVFTRHQLLEHVWESSSEWQDEATVTEHVRRIRRKIEADPDQPRWITTVRGVGYRFES